MMSYTVATLYVVNALSAMLGEDGLDRTEEGCKFAAKMMLCSTSRKIVVPSEDEWAGIVLLERDDELVRGQEQKHIGRVGFDA